MKARSGLLQRGQQEILVISSQRTLEYRAEQAFDNKGRNLVPEASYPFENVIEYTLGAEWWLWVNKSEGRSKEGRAW